MQHGEGSRMNSEEQNSLMAAAERNKAVIIRNIDRDGGGSSKEDGWSNKWSPPPEEVAGVGGLSQPVFVPADGGCRAWVVMVASFMCNGIIFGVINTYSVIYVKLKAQLEEAGEHDASLKGALVGSMAIGTTFFLSPVAGIMTDSLGLQPTAFIGGILATTGMVASSFVTCYMPSKIELLCLTYGIIFGAGASLAYTPSLVILGHYFRRYTGFVNGFVTAGSSVFTVIMPFLLEYLLSSVGLEGSLAAMAGMMAVLVLCAFLFVPQMPRPKLPASTETKSRCAKCCDWKSTSFLNTDIWKNKKYVIWTLAIPSALFGYFVPYVHLVQHAKDTFPKEDGKVLVLCIGITSGLGRLIFGKIADFPKVNRIRLQQISFVSIGLLTLFLSIARPFPLLVVMSLAMGLFDGCFISLLGPIAFDICGPSGASQAIGFLLGLCSIPLTTGPAVAGALYDLQGNYTLAFILAGIPPIVGATAMCLIDRVKGPPNFERSGSPENDYVPAATCEHKERLGPRAAPNGDVLQSVSNGDLPPPGHETHSPESKDGMEMSLAASEERCPQIQGTDTVVVSPSEHCPQGSSALV